MHIHTVSTNKIHIRIDHKYIKLHTYAHKKYMYMHTKEHGAVLGAQAQVNIHVYINTHVYTPFVPTDTYISKDHKYI